MYTHVEIHTLIDREIEGGILEGCITRDALTHRRLDMRRHAVY